MSMYENDEVDIKVFPLSKSKTKDMQKHKKILTGRMTDGV